MEVTFKQTENLTTCFITQYSNYILVSHILFTAEIKDKLSVHIFLPVSADPSLEAMHLPDMDQWGRFSLDYGLHGDKPATIFPSNMFP